MIPTNPMEQFSPFLPATFNVPAEEDRLDVYLVDKLSQFSDVINNKTIGVFTQSLGLINGNSYAYDTTSKIRTGYQYLARIASYPANGSITVAPPPNLNNQLVITQAWGSASKPPTSTPGTGDYFSFFGSGNPKITFTFSDTAIIITTSGLGSGYSGFIFVTFIHDGI